MTPKAQRIGILVIAVVMVVGTLGSFAMLILANDNAQKEQDRLQREYQEQLEKDQKQAEELSKKYYPQFSTYKSRVATFDADKVGDKVTHVDLKKGDGEAITDDTKYKMYYMGWNPKGKMFDSSFADDDKSLKPPLTHLGGGIWEFAGGQTGNVIPGWTEGIKGMKIGGVRELTIPSDLAYGETGGGDDIPPNTPLKFVIMAIPDTKE